MGTTEEQDTAAGQEHKKYPADALIATAEPAAMPTAAEYQKLLLEMSDLRQYVKTREITYQNDIISFRNDIIRERRRREVMEDALRQEFRMKAERPSVTFSDAMEDEEAPSPMDHSDTRQAPQGLSLNPYSLNPKKNTAKFSALKKQNSDQFDTSRRSEASITSNFLHGDIPPEKDDEDELEGTEIPLLPHDTFSFLAFSKLNSIPLFIAMCVIGVQLLTLIVLFVDMFGEGEPGNILGIPKGINQSTATIQVVAIFIITVGQTDLHDSLNTLFIGYEAYELSAAVDRPVPRWRWTISLWTRISITLFALVVTFIMICTESDTTQVLLDFTSIEFVTNLDNIFFWLCAYGYMGFGAQKDATLVLNAKPFSIILPKSQDTNDDKMHKSLVIRSEGTKMGLSQEKTRTFPRLLFTASLFFVMIIAWGIIFNWIRQGEFLCETVFVQFVDDATPDLAPFSGLYNRGCSDQVGNCRRVKYWEAERGIHHQSSHVKHTAKFAYCVEKASWGFTFGNETSDVENGKTSPCDWKAHSRIILPKSQDSYDIMSTTTDFWKVLNRWERDVPFKGFELRCFDCKHIPSFCGGEGRGECVNNRCECKNGWYGRRCEFTPPCESIEFTDPERDIVDGRRFATKYQRMYHHNGDPFEIYDRPVYEGFIDESGEIGSTNQVFFNGLRWVLVTDLGDVLRSHEFHGYWSAKSGTYNVEFYSAAVRVDSPEDSTSPDGLSWFRPKLTKDVNRNVQGVDLTSQAPFKFLCATCNDETNPCLHSGICQPEKNNTCDCISGASGRLCQILPTGNGRCDEYFNDKEHAWDGGDCCEDTCVSTDEHTCGRDIVENSQGVESIGFVGYDNCKDPSVARVVSGSRTIYDIKQRGVVNCGTIFTTTWFYNFMADQCRAVAAAVLDDPNAIQLFNFTNDRFTGLRDKRFDIVFWTDYTAHRDVYESTARTGFNYATIPYYFGGFVFAGIKPFGSCANEGDFFSSECSDIKMCLVGGTTWFDTASQIFPSKSIVTYNDFESTVVAFENNECNVIGGSQVDVELISVRPFGFTGDASDYEVGSKLYFKSFETWITRDDDRMWSRFTSWVFESLVQAEESNITQTTSDLMGTTDVFGDEFNLMFKRAVAAVGNYGEMWDRNLPFTRSGMNLINDGSTGAMLSFDFGRVLDEGPEPSRSSVIRTIIARDSLRCGITGETLGFAEFDDITNTWSGFDIDLCRGIAAALFDGDDSRMVVTQITVTNRFSKIQSGQVDIVPSSTRTLEREVNIGVNNDAFDFSPVYFHDGMIFAGEMPHAVCAENQDFTNNNCTETKICVTTGSTWYDALTQKLGIEEDYLVLTSNFDDSMQLHLIGVCNVIVGENGRLNLLSLEAAGYPITESYYIGTRKFSKDPLCLMHRSDDPQFSDFIKWVMFGFFYAEENDITSVNFFDMPETNLFGKDFTKIWQHSIRRVGNYAEIYGRSLGSAFPRSGMNLLNDLASPQLFSAPGTV